MKNVKIRLLTDRGLYVWLRVNYFPKRRGGGVDNFYLTDYAHEATPIAVKNARKWMREAKSLANFDGIVVKKGEYILDGKPTTLVAAALAAFANP